MKKLCKKISAVLLAASVVMSFAALPDTAYAAVTKTVSTQKALTQALKNSKVSTVKISAKKKVTLTIPKGNYTKKNISVNGSRVKLVNKGNVKNITVTSAETIVQYGSANKITVRSKNTDVVLKKGSKTSKVNNTKSGMRLLSNSKTVIDADAGASVILKTGAESSTVDVKGSDDYTSVINYSEDYVTAKDDEGSKAIKPGEVYSAGENNSAGAAESDDPFRKISGMQKVKGLAFEVHGFGEFASMTTKEGVHGWYYNKSTGTFYECRFVIAGDTVTLKHLSNVNFETKYLGEAKFRIKETTDKYIELESIVDTYGDNGESYRLYFGGGSNDDAPVNTDNPLVIFSGLAGGMPVSLDIHGCGTYSYMSHGDSIHGWYSNILTDTQYECVFEVNGNHVTAEMIDNSYNRNYLGDAEFEIVSYDSTEVVLRSISEVYRDNGNVYTFIATDEDTREEVNSDNPLVIFSGMTESNDLSLEIHGRGQYSDMSYGNSIHGWYHNRKTGTDYECRFVVRGNRVTATYLDNRNYNKNYLGVAEFEIVSADNTSVTMKSTNDVYGDMGAVYVFRAGNSGGDTREPVNPDNPLVMFKGPTSDGFLQLDIHGSGKYSDISYGNSIHGWYHNLKTGTDYECRYVVEGNTVTATYIENINFNKNYLGEAEFEIVAYDSHSVTMKSVNDIYGDSGTEYVFVPCETTGPVNPDNPLTVFSGPTSAGGLKLEIHGSGTYSRYSHGDSIHGWYHNRKTGTDYECRFVVYGNHIVASYVNNRQCNKNYLGTAQFEIVSYDSTSVTLKSVNDIYGDIGTVYVFRAN